MEIINFIKNYWVQIMFLGSMLATMITFISSLFEATKCSLRNDILEIYDRCKENKLITKYQLESVEYSYTMYKKLHGNSFVSEIVGKMRQFELID